MLGVLAGCLGLVGTAWGLAQLACSTLLAAGGPGAGAAAGCGGPRVGCAVCAWAAAATHLRSSCAVHQQWSHQGAGSDSMLLSLIEIILQQ
jgi:hypothetical protein